MRHQADPNNRKLRLSITNISDPEPNSFLTWKKNYYHIFLNWGNWVLFGQYKKAKAFEANQNRKLNDMMNQTRYINSELFAWYKNSDYLTYEEICFISQEFISIEQATTLIYRSTNDWHSVLSKLKVINQKMVEILDMISFRGSYFGSTVLAGQLAILKQEIETFGFDMAEFILIHNHTGKPQILTPKEFLDYENKAVHQ